MNKRNSLRWEIVVMLMLKLSLLYVLWSLCFSHPLDKDLKPADISQHLTSTLNNNNHDRT